MSETWKDRYKLAVLTYFLGHGDPVAPVTQTIRPWDDGMATDGDAAREHVIACGIDLGRSRLLEQTDWVVWGGSFGDNEYVSGQSVALTCKCSRYIGRAWRLEPTRLAEMINGLLEAGE